MISVLLTLLKIIGIILLSLLGLILIIMLLVLFVPARYRLKGYYKDEFVAHGRITWLLHFLSITIAYNKEPVTTIKILGISIDKFIKKDTKPDKKDVPDTEKAVTNDSNDKNKIHKLADADSDSKISSEPMSDITSETSSDRAMDLTDDKSREETTTPNNIFDKIKNVIKKIKESILSIYQKICDIIDKIKSGKETVSQYIAILKRAEVKEAFSLCKKKLWKLIKHILPKKMKVNLHVGFDDPATTGYVLAGYSILPSSISKKIILHTDFDKQILECDFNVKGHVNAWSLLYQVLCVVFDKNCKSLYQIVKKEILNERK